VDALEAIQSFSASSLTFKYDDKLTMRKSLIYVLQR